MSYVNTTIIWHRISSAHSLRGYAVSISLDEVLSTSFDEFKLSGTDGTSDTIQNVSTLLMNTKYHSRLTFGIYGSGKCIVASNSLKLDYLPLNKSIRHTITLLCYCCPKLIDKSLYSKIDKKENNTNKGECTMSSDRSSTKNTTYEIEFTIIAERATTEDILIHNLTKLRKQFKIRNNVSIRSSSIGVVETEVIKQMLRLYPEFHNVPPISTSMTMLASICTYLWSHSIKQHDPQMQYYMSSPKPAPSLSMCPEYKRNRAKCKRGYKLIKPSNNRYALLIAMDYPKASPKSFDKNPIPSLQVYGMRVRQTMIFKSFLMGYYLFPSKFVEILSDASSVGSKHYASYNNIKNEFNRLTHLIKPGDAIVVAICGEGRRKRPGSIMTADLKELSIADIENHLLHSIPVGCKLTLILDSSNTACMSVDMRYHYDYNTNEQTISSPIYSLKGDIIALCSMGKTPPIHPVFYISIAMTIAIGVLKCRTPPTIQDLICILKDKFVYIYSSKYLYRKARFNMMDNIIVNK